MNSQNKSNSNGLFIVFAVLGGILVVGFLLCAGILGLVYYVGSRAAESIAQEMKRIEASENEEELNVSPELKRLIDQEDASPVPTSLPPYPFDLPAPTAEAKTHDGSDLSQEDAGLLFSVAQEFYEDQNYAVGLQFQYWAVENSQRTEGYYDLACFYALLGRVDNAIYALQMAAATEGVDVAWSTQDTDLESVHNDPRWANLLVYLRRTERYWSNTELSKTSVILPKNYDGKSPIPVMIGLHGYGSSPDGFVDDAYQSIADRLNVAFVAVNATETVGPNSFQWSEDVEKDREHVEKVLKGIPDLVPDRTKIGLFGFSQGGFVAIAMAARYPNDYRGALIMSPGGNSTPDITEYPRDPKHSQQQYFVTVGAGEAYGNVIIARAFDRSLNDIGAPHELKVYPDMSEHSFPPDFIEKLPEWTSKILGIQ